MAICPKDYCKSSKEKEIVSQSDGSDNIDNLPYTHYGCKECGCQFLEWDCDKSRIKAAFGEGWQTYM